MAASTSFMSNKVSLTYGILNIDTQYEACTLPSFLGPGGKGVLRWEVSSSVGDIRDIGWKLKLVGKSSTI